MNLRHVVRSNKVTAQMVKDYKEKYGCSIEHAKMKLLNKRTDLECWNEELQKWEVVPTVFEVKFEDNTN